MEILRRIGNIVSRENSNDPLRSQYPEYAEIRDMAQGVAKIWFTNSRDKSGGYHRAANKILEKLTEEIIKDPAYINGLTDDDHFRVLELLDTFVPDHDPEHADFTSTKPFMLIDVYLKTLIPLWIKSTDSDETVFNKRNIIKRSSGLPACYIESVIGACCSQQKNQTSGF